jgi:hypothetical protein
VKAHDKNSFQGTRSAFGSGRWLNEGSVNLYKSFMKYVAFVPSREMVKLGLMAAMRPLARFGAG